MKPKSRICPECCATRYPGEGRCPCQRKPKFKSPYPKDLNAAHAYALRKVWGKGFGLKNDFRKAYWGFVYKPKGPRRSFVVQDNKAIALFMYRTEVAYKHGDQWAGLIGRRVALRLHGKTNEEVCEWLDLSRRELDLLDEIIIGEGYIPRLPRSQFDGAVPPVVRKMKKGVAQEILRRWMHKENYNLGQVLAPHIVSPFKW
jgi:hypothetical protein